MCYASLFHFQTTVVLKSFKKKFLKQSCNSSLEICKKIVGIERIVYTYISVELSCPSIENAVA